MKGPIVLLGASGAGKSSAGEQAARALGMRFIDLDDVIGDVPTIFRDEGEASFRVREHLALDAALDGSDVVIAAGAGVVDAAPARALLAQRAICVHMDVDGDSAVNRLRAQAALSSGAARGRPWLPLDGRALKVWTERDEPRRRHRAALAASWAAPTVDARGAVDVVTGALVSVIDELKPVRVGAPPVDVLFVSSVALALECARGLATVAPSTAATPTHGASLGGTAIVVVEQTIAKLHGVRGDVVVDGGESLKTLARVEQLAAALVDKGARRDTLVVAVGGGALLDAVGLASALLYRGVAWCAVPTTLLAQVDAGIGGKTAVSLGGKKNLVGAFHAPLKTIVCSAFLDTLPESELRAGRTEMLKHEMIAADAPPDGTATSAGTQADQVRRSLAIKAGVVARDPNERGLRAVLNLGHTFGHALEAATTIGHGEAVRHGLLRMLELSVAHAGLDAGVARTLGERVKALGPMASLDAMGVDERALDAALKADKKAGRWVLLRAPGLPVVRAVC